MKDGEATKTRRMARNAQHLGRNPSQDRGPLLGKDGMGECLKGPFWCCTYCDTPVSSGMC